MRARTVTVGVAALLALSACAGEPEPAAKGSRPPEAVLGAPEASAVECRWTEPAVTIADAPATETTLQGVASDGGSGAWAVGSAGQGDSSGPLIQRWDGAQWSAAPVKGLPAEGELEAVATASEREAWAVGTDGADAALIVRWNGSVWAKSRTPRIDSGYLYGVAALPGRAWAVGERQDDSGAYGPLAMSWNGKRWREETLPSFPGAQMVRFNGVHARAANDVWAVGMVLEENGFQRSLIVRFDGRRWRVVRSPSPGEDTNELESVSMAGPRDGWAVGKFDTKAGMRALVLRWDGKAWKTLKAPIPGDAGVRGGASPPYGPTLSGVVAVGPGEMWAVGEMMASDEENITLTSRPLILRWDGSAWSRSTPVRLVEEDGFLQAVAKGSGSWLVAVGFGSELKPLRVHGTCA